MDALRSCGLVLGRNRSPGTVFSVCVGGGSTYEGVMMGEVSSECR